MAGIGSALIGAGSGLIGMIGQNHRANKQHDRQKELMDIQNRNQQGLNQQGHDLQMDMWNKTNAKAQVEHYKEAGLNPGLMYGGSGAGGATTGSQGGGSAASGTAAAPMDIGNITQMMKAFGEIALNLSKENKNDSDVNVNDSVVPLNTAKKDNIVEDTQGKNISNELASMTMDDLIGQARNELDLGKSKLVAQEIENRINKETEEDQIDQIKEDALRAEFEKQLTQQNIKVSREKERVLWHSIIQEYLKSGASIANALTGGISNMMTSFAKKVLGKKTTKRTYKDPKGGTYDRTTTEFLK